MKTRYLPTPVRALASILLVLLSSVSFWACAATFSNWDDLWSGGDFYHSYSIYKPTSGYRSMVHSMMSLNLELEAMGKLSYSDQEQLQSLQEALDPANTNFRYQVHHQDTHALLYGSMSPAGGETLVAQERWDMSIEYGHQYAALDIIRTDDVTNSDILSVYTPEGAETLRARDYVDQFCEYGWYSDGESWWSYDSGRDNRVHTLSFAMETGVTNPLTVQDDFWEMQNDYDELQGILPGIAVLGLVSLVLSVALLGLLCRFAGHWKEDPEHLTLTWHDRIPTDLYALIYICLISVCLGAGDAAAFGLNHTQRMAPVVGVGFFTVLIASLTLCAILTTAVRLKAHTFWSSMWLWRLCKALGRGIRDIFARQSMNQRVVWLFCLYLLGTLLTSLTLVLIPFYQGFVLWLICRWIRQWRVIRQGTEAIVGGAPDTVIDTSGMDRFPDLMEHAQQLNDLSTAISKAVDERMKSERMKSELITNVSHDLKTPLTSIINYVDLLKKEDIQESKALEYIEVLDRKSQRLKKLTEDLVEASKASTGALTVNKDKLGFTQLLTQALGEYEEKFEKSTLSPVLTSPDHELYVEADGRHLWRVMDNLLGNCVKYAMPGTRVYLDVKSWDGSVTLSVKNISKDPLNIPADQLMERFVRGDASRTAEGSGLGLSIARSLTELQGGSFRLDIDGDLFKAVVTFPEYKEPLSLPENRPE